MKPFLILLLSIGLVENIYAQNLVPNPSFEDTVYCSDLGRLNGCQYWVNCGNTPDYDHACHVGTFGVPGNYIGYQEAATGNAYCQIETYVITTQNLREYVGVPLIQPMLTGNSYDVSFKCSPGTRNGYCLQADKIGLRFSTVAFDSLHPPPIDNFAHVYANDVITDTSNWTTVSGTLVADSNYTFLVIGNFFDDANTDTMIPSAACSGFSLYYIDDVSVTDSTTGIMPFQKSFLNLSQTGNTIQVSFGEVMENIELFNSIGQTIIRKNLASHSTSLYVGNIPSGIYLVRIQTQNRSFITKFFIS